MNEKEHSVDTLAKIPQVYASMVKRALEMLKPTTLQTNIREKKRMSETETILKNESGVKCAEGDSKGYIGLGTLVLTNLRLVYINKEGRGATAAMELFAPLVGRSAIEKKAGKADLDDAAKLPGSFSIPIEGITRAENVRHFLAAYLRVDSQSPNLKPVHNFFFNTNASSCDWANSINSAIAARSPQTSAQPTTFMPPPPPPPPPPPS